MPAPTLADYTDTMGRRFGAEFKGPKPKVSVVTITFRARETLTATIDSVQAQLFQECEHVVVDGDSGDGTVELLQSRLRPQDYWISEADRGISDAFNKGVALSAGEYVQFINADDWMSPEQLQCAVAAIERTGADFVFGDLVFYEGGVPTFRYGGEPDYQRAIGRRMPSLNHPTVLVRRAAFERIGLFDLSYRCAMDYDWFLRLHRAGGRGVYDPSIIAHMNHAGVSNLQFRRTIREVESIAVAHGRPRVLARTETLLRLGKTGLSQSVKRRARPLYDAVRRTINPSYRAIR